MKYVLFLLLAGFLAGCSSHDGLSKDTSARVQHSRSIRTTAYSHGEDGNQNALGNRLRSGAISSAAADWSRFPMGTRFRVLSTNQVYIIDDYGGALVGRECIDLYMPTMRQMRNWGVRRVDIEILHWGSYAESLHTLRPRSRDPLVRRMIASLEKKV